MPAELTDHTGDTASSRAGPSKHHSDLIKHAREWHAEALLSEQAEQMTVIPPSVALIPQNRARCPRADKQVGSGCCATLCWQRFKPAGGVAGGAVERPRPQPRPHWWPVNSCPAPFHPGPYGPPCTYTQAPLYMHTDSSISYILTVLGM
ncbi:hypothetical protein AOLI_G00303020 [Acnodon oligacanthus]